MHGGVPVLVDGQRSIVTPEMCVRSQVRRAAPSGPQATIRHLLTPTKRSTRHNISRLLGFLSAEVRPIRILVVGGATVGQGTKPLYDHRDTELIAFDIYESPNVQFIADAHQIPLPAASIDCVLVQAVLEHVLEPALVVAEIHRVLRPGGLVYAETPFMQQVHEGPYDFTRFTEGGHRYLFRDFDEIASGASAGPAVQFLWSVDYLVSGLFRSRLVGKMARLLLSWMRILDRLIPERFAVDGASGVFFLGRRSEHRLSGRNLVTRYRGAQV
jgi:SAM-dependent methyltransferase